MRKRFIYLDGLRGLAALSVVFGHFLGAFYPALGPSTNRTLLPYLGLPVVRLFLDGDFCVCVFFALSGFVLTYKFFATNSSDVSLAVAKRYFRLAIPVLASILLAYLLLEAGLFRNGAAATLTGSSWQQSFYGFKASGIDALKQGLYGVFAHAQTATWYNPVLWTMKVELIGSMLVYAVVAMFGKRKNPWIVFAAATLISILAKSYYAAFMLGMLLAYLYATQPGWLRGRLLSWLRGYRLWVVGAIALVAADFLSSQSYNQAGLVTYRTPIHVAGAVALLTLCLTAPQLQRILATRPIAFLGRISFSLYLVHFLILMSFSSQVYLIARGWQLTNSLALIITFGLSAIIILATSYYFTRFIDEPGTQLARWLGNAMLKPGKLRLPAPSLPPQPEPARLAAIKKA